MSFRAVVSGEVGIPLLLGSDRATCVLNLVSGVMAAPLMFAKLAKDSLALLPLLAQERAKYYRLSTVD